jgi:hypothetical protein
VSGQHHAPAALYPRKGPVVPTGQEAGWASELVWIQRLEENSFLCAGDRTPVVQSLVRHTDWATPARKHVCAFLNVNRSFKRSRCHHVAVCVVRQRLCTAMENGDRQGIGISMPWVRTSNALTAGHFVPRSAAHVIKVSTSIVRSQPTSISHVTCLHYLGLSAVWFSRHLEAECSRGVFRWGRDEEGTVLYEHAQIIKPLKLDDCLCLAESESRYGWRSVKQPVLVSSPFWDSWPDFEFDLETIAVFDLLGGGALSDERVGLSFVGSLCHDFYVVSEYLQYYIHYTL